MPPCSDHMVYDGALFLCSLLIVARSLRLLTGQCLVPTLSLRSISHELKRNSGQRYDFVLKELKQCEVRFLFAPFHGGEARAPGARGLVNWGLSKPGLSRELGWPWPKLLKPLTQHKAPLWRNSISGCALCYRNEIYTSPKLCAR